MANFSCGGEVRSFCPLVFALARSSSGFGCSSKSFTKSRSLSPEKRCVVDKRWGPKVCCSRANLRLKLWYFETSWWWASGLRVRRRCEVQWPSRRVLWSCNWAPIFIWSNRDSLCLGGLCLILFVPFCDYCQPIVQTSSLCIRLPPRPVSKAIIYCAESRYRDRSDTRCRIVDVSIVTNYFGAGTCPCIDRFWGLLEFKSLTNSCSIYAWHRLNNSPDSLVIRCLSERSNRYLNKRKNSILRQELYQCEQKNCLFIKPIKNKEQVLPQHLKQGQYKKRDLLKCAISVTSKKEGTQYWKQTK